MMVAIVVHDHVDALLELVAVRHDRGSECLEGHSECQRKDEE
jgi:hypothetical protein